MSTTNNILVENITLSHHLVRMEPASSFTLTATVSPSNATNKGLIWSSSIPALAVVNNGVVFSTAPGDTTVITVTAADGSGCSDSCQVEVTLDTLVYSVNVTPASTSIAEGQSVQLQVAVVPSSATNPNVTWESSNPSVASVSETGLVTAHSTGNAVITATSSDGTWKSDSCSLTVTEAIHVTSISLSNDSLTLQQGDHVGIVATVLPANATNKTVLWTSSNPSVAAVEEESGIITAVSQGSAIITATTVDGNKRASCTVTVNALVQTKYPALRTVQDCYVRLFMDTSNSSILKNEAGAYVVLRAQTDTTEADIVHLLSTTKISSGTNQWYRILYDGMMLYVTADDSSFEEILLDTPPTATKICDVQVNTNNDGNLYVRSTPSQAETALGKFAHGKVLSLLNTTPQNRSWYAVYGETTDGSFSYGWCSGKNLNIYDTFGILTDVEQLHVRASVSTNSESYGIIHRNDTVRIISEEAGTSGGYYWYEIVYQYKTGYVIGGGTSPNFTIENKWGTLMDYGVNDADVLNPPVYSFSQKGIELLKEFEGFKETAYRASSSETLYTIGYGHVITDGSQNVVINGNSYSELTEELATILLLEDLENIFIPKFNIFLQQNDIVLNQHQYDACVLDCYQKGQNIWANQVRLIAKFILAKQSFYNYNEVVVAFLDGTSNNGLINRRTKEAELFVYDY